MSCIHSGIEKYTLLDSKVIFIDKTCFYHVNNYILDVPKDVQNIWIDESFNEWNEHLHRYGYSFKRTEDKFKATLQIWFVGGETKILPTDEYKYLMNDPGMVGFYVVGKGLLYINDDLDFKDDINLKVVLIHEIGHALGIGHTIISNDYMYPKYQPGNYFTSDTLAAIRKIYAPNTVKNSLLNLTVWEIIGVITVLFLTYKLLTNAFE